MRTNSRIALLAVLAAGVALRPTEAFANGRFPRAEKLIESPSDPNRLTIAATYGILVTNDRKNWYYLCETAFSFQTAYTGDPLFGLTSDESLLVGTDLVLTRSHDRGCDWTKVAEPPNANFNDFAAAPSKPGTIVAMVTFLAGGKPTLRLQESTDDGVTWLDIGTPMPIMVGYTIDVDPKDANHFYATGVLDTADSTTPGLLLSSKDHGMTWSSTPIPNTSGVTPPYIAKIHPDDPNKIFVRVDSWKNRDVVDTADDALLYSADAGKTWTELLHPGGPDPDSPGAKLLGFALSPDGMTVLAGYGDPVDGSRLVERNWAGVYKSSSDGKYTFPGTPTMPDPPLVDDLVSCLTWTKNGIYICFSLDGRPQYIDFAKDANFNASSLTRLLNIADTRGSPTCCNGRSTSTCDWSFDCARLSACVDDGGLGAGDTCSADAAPPVSDGGAGDAAGAADKPGCGCRFATAGRARWHAAACFVAMLARWPGRRSRRGEGKPRQTKPSRGDPARF